MKIKVILKLCWGDPGWFCKSGEEAFSRDSVIGKSRNLQMREEKDLSSLFLPALFGHFFLKFFFYVFKKLFWWDFLWKCKALISFKMPRKNDFFCKKVLVTKISLGQNRVKHGSGPYAWQDIDEDYGVGEWRRAPVGFWWFVKTQGGEERIEDWRKMWKCKVGK